MIESVGNAVGQRPLKPCPDKLIGVKLGSIAGEVVSLKTGMGLEEPFNRRRLVNRASVPEKDNLSSKVSEQMTQESNRLFGLNVFIGMEADVKPKPSSLRRNADSGDGRDFRPVSSRAKNRGFAFRRPRFDNSRDEQESAFVKEDQMGSKPLGLFLYAARPDVSSSESRLLVFPWPAWSASDSSSPGFASNTRGWNWNNGYGNVSGLPRQSAAVSRPGLKNLLPEDLWRESVSTSVSSPDLTGEDVLACVSTAAHPSLVFGRLDSSAPPSLKKSASGRQRHERSSLSGEAVLHNAFAFPVVSVCQGVSYPILYNRLSIVSIINWRFSRCQYA